MFVQIRSTSPFWCPARKPSTTDRLRSARTWLSITPTTRYACSDQSRLGSDHIGGIPKLPADKSLGVTFDDVDKAVYPEAGANGLTVDL